MEDIRRAPIGEWHFRQITTARISLIWSGSCQFGMVMVTSGQQHSRCCQKRVRVTRFGMPSALCAFATGVWLRSNAGMPNRTLGYAVGHRFAVRRFTEPLSPRISYSGEKIMCKKILNERLCRLCCIACWLIELNSHHERLGPGLGLDGRGSMGWGFKAHPSTSL